MHSGNALCQGILYIIIIVAGGWFVAHGKLEAPELAIYALYVGIYLHPVEMILHFTEQFQRGMSGFKRFDELMRLTPEIQDAPDAESLTGTSGRVEFKAVRFGYVPGKEVLHGVDLELHPGRTTALVGVSGGGKSTICALLMRFYDILDGSITLDGRDIRKIKQEDLRRHIGIVQQDMYMFNGTVRENILYGKLDASDDQMIEAAKKAHIHDFVMTLPNGYDTEIGERGVRLSGGQKQRLSIARVFLKDPEILILDEATSALDNESERKIQSALAELTKGRTTLVIAHRLSTVRNADEIVVIEDGKVVERGTHQQLTEKNGSYARLSHI
jgi:ATP-binding cassette subfamily B protein